MADRIRVGVAGCGEISQVMHLRFVDELPEFELAALCDLSAVVLQSLGAKYRVGKLFTSYEEMLQRAGVDAVLVATPDHAGPALAALDMGKHLLLEKPAAYSVSDARAIASAAGRSPAVAMMGYMRVYDPGYDLVRRQVAAMSHIRLVRSHDFGGNFDRHAPLFPLVRPAPAEELEDPFAEFVTAKTARLLREAAGPDESVQHLLWSLLMGATHDLSVVRDLIGSPREIVSSAVDKSRLLACIAFERALCTVEWDTAGGYDWWDQHLTIYGLDRTCAVSFADPYIPYLPAVATIRMPDADATAIRTLDVPSEPAFRREWRHFAQCIQTGSPPRTTIAGGLEDIELIHELVRAGARQ